MAALMRDTNARTIHSNLAVDAPFQASLAERATDGVQARPGAMYRYVTPRGKFLRESENPAARETGGSEAKHVIDP